MSELDGGLLSGILKMGRNFKLERLQRGESFITSEKGNSMTPLIKSGQDHRLEPITLEDVEVGDIVYCKVRGNWYTHLVTAKNEKRGCQISNNKGRVNGWTKKVYGVVTEVIGGKYKRKKKPKKKDKMSEEIKRIDIKEFREQGYLQEANRRFFHPLGMALEVVVDDDGNESLGGIWDYREDKEGVYYDIKNSDKKRKKRFAKNKKFVDKQMDKKTKSRMKTLGFDIEPIE